MSNPVEVTCPAGTVVGRVDGDIARFHSIEYSRIPAPFDDAVPAPRGMLIDATTPQPSTTALSIVAPLGSTDADDLPVVVHIHGGRFEMGNHEDEASPGDALARAGVILVRIGYRLKLEGLVPFPDDKTGHFRAVDDVALGLEWVQQNIEAFGGDPTNVTLTGQSAGANIVLWLMRRDHYRGAFRRVLALSPAFPRLTYDQRKRFIRAGAGIPLTRASLNKATPRQLRRGYGAVRGRYFTDMALGPAPLDTAELADVDLVISSLTDEMYASGSFWDALKMARLNMILPGFIMGLKRSEYRRFFRALKARAPKNITGEFFSANLIRRWVDQVSEGAPGRVWQAELTADSMTPARHSADLAPLFGAPPYPGSSGLNGWLVRYATTGEPGWPEYKPDRTVLRVDLSGENASLVHDPLGYLRGVFREV